MRKQNQSTHKNLFKTKEEEQAFYDEYQRNLDKSLQTAHKENEDRFFVQKKLFQFLAAIGSIYAFFTQDERTPLSNTIFLSACAGATFVSVFREQNQMKDLNISTFKDAHFSFYSNKIAQTQITAEKIRLLKLADAILPLERLNQKKHVNNCFFLSTTILVGSTLLGKITLEPALFAETLIWGSCTLANYINNNTQIKLIQNNLPKEIKFTEQKSYER